jgi:hypothetical protein
MNWYRTLDLHQRINLKELSETICGVRFESMVMLFGLKDSLDLLHEKLKIEGFQV